MSEALKVLQESNGLLPTLIENLLGGTVFVVDRHLRYIVAQGETLSAVGFKPEDFVGRTLFEALPPELATKYEGLYRQALAGVPFETEHKFHHHTYMTRGTPLWAANGEIYAVLAVSYEISDCKRVEIALRESEEQMQAIINQMTAGIARTDLSGAFTFVNQKYCEMLGCDADEIIGKKMQDFTHPDDLAHNLEWFWNLAQTGEPFEIEKRYICKDKRIIWVHNSVSALRDANGNITQLLAVSVDITAAKHLEESRSRAEAALHESEAKYRSLFESINDGFALLEVLYDADNQPIDCRFLEVSPSFEAQTTLPQAQGKTLRELIPSVEPDWFKHYHQALVTNDPVHFEMYQSHIKIWFEVDVLPYGNPQDRQVMIVFQNINDRKQAEAERLQLIREQSAREQERQRAESLAELDRAKTLFFSNVSHEFRTPLTLSLAPLQDALSDRTHPLDPVHRERLELVHRNSLRLLKLVNTLLDFSRIEAGRMEAVYEPTDLATYTAELASVFRSAIERAGLQLIVDCPPLPELIFVDREMWEKIVLNLLFNAFKFTFEGEIRVSLHSTDSNQAILRIQDTGTGIAPEHLPHLFERFYQVRGTQARTHDGSGIGLALVHELVRLQGGTIEVSSTVAEGTCFTIALPFGTEHLPSDRLHFEGDRYPVRTLASTAMGATAYVEEAERWLPEKDEGGRMKAEG